MTSISIPTIRCNQNIGKFQIRIGHGEYESRSRPWASDNVSICLVIPNGSGYAAGFIPSCVHWISNIQDVFGLRCTEDNCVAVAGIGRGWNQQRFGRSINGRVEWIARI